MTATYSVTLKTVKHSKAVSWYFQPSHNFDESFPAKLKETAGEVWEREAFKHLEKLQHNFWEYVSEVFRLNEFMERPEGMDGKYFHQAPKELAKTDWYLLNRHHQAILVSEHRLVRESIPEGVELPYNFWRELKSSADWDVLPWIFSVMPTHHLQTYLEDTTSHGSSFRKELKMIIRCNRDDEFGRIPYMWFIELYS